MTRTLFVLCLLATIGCASQDHHDHADHTDHATIKAELNLMMQASADAWTDDDLDAFMRAFHNSPDLTFAIPTGITKGWAPLKQRYAKSINRSNLWFTDIEVTPITDDTALVFARFHNEMKDDGSYSTGLTTLLCRKIDGNWVIVHDHSSGLPAGTPRRRK